MFAGTVKKRTVKLLEHEYETLLPHADETTHEAFEFKYEGPEKVFTKMRQVAKQGGLHIGDRGRAARASGPARRLERGRSASKRQ